MSPSIETLDATIARAARFVKRLEREAKATAARALEAERDWEDDLEAMFRAAVQVSSSAGRSAERTNEHGRAISSQDN